MTEEVLQAPATENPAESKPETANAEGVNTGAPVEETDEEKNKRIQDEAAEASRQREEKRRASVQRRMDELTAEKYEARKQLQEAMEQNRRMLAMLEGKNAAPSQANAEPQRDQFDSYEDFVTARAEFRAEMKAQAAVKTELERFQRESKETQARTAQETEAKAVEREFLQRRAEAEKRFPDFREVVDGWEPQIPGEVADLILRLPDGPAISYHLAKNPALEGQLRDAPKHMQGVILGEIRSALKAATSETKAPPPGKPVGSKAATTTDGNYSGDPDGYMAWARKNLK